MTKDLEMKQLIFRRAKPEPARVMELELPHKYRLCVRISVSEVLCSSMYLHIPCMSHDVGPRLRVEKREEWLPQH